MVYKVTLIIFSLSFSLHFECVGWWSSRISISEEEHKLFVYSADWWGIVKSAEVALFYWMGSDTSDDWN